MNLASRELAGPTDAPVLLLLHGVTRDWRDWKPLLPALAHDWRVVAVDHCGHGDSPRTPGEYLVADYARHTAEFVRANFVTPVTVLGHSLGAMVALSLAANSLVSGAILEDPPFHTMGRDIALTPYRAQFAGMREVALRGGSVELMTDALASITVPAPGGGTVRLGDVRERAALEFSADCLQRLDPEVLAPLIAGRWLDGFDHAALFSRVKCPLLLLRGDPAAGGAFTDADAALAPSHARHVRFVGAGHQIHRTRAVEFLSALRAWRGA